MRRLHRAAVLAAAVIVGSGMGVGAAAAGPPVLFVTSDSGAVTPINTSTHAVGRPIAVGAGLGDIVLTPNGTTAFVLNYRGGTLVPVTVATGARGAAISLPGANSLAMSPDGRTVWVAGYGGLVPVNTATKAKGAVIHVAATRMALTPNGRRAYVISGSDVRPVDLISRVVGAPINVAPDPISLAMAPNGGTLYVGTDRGSVCVVGSARTVTPQACGGGAFLVPVSTATNRAGTPIPIGRSPYNVAITPDGSTAYAVSDTIDSDTVTPVSLATRTARAPIHVGEFPYGIAITPDGRTAFVIHDDQAGCGCSGSVTTFDTRTGAAGAPIRTSADPFDTAYGIAITAAQAPYAVFAGTPARHGAASRFDARSSHAAYGSIAHYVWSFGDGTTTTTSSAQVSHVYRTAGHYTVRLGVIDSTGTSTGVVYTGQAVSRNGAARAATSRVLTVV